MNDNPYKKLAIRLNSLPNGFPPVQDGAEIRLLRKLFTPGEAELAATLHLTPETPQKIVLHLKILVGISTKSRIRSSLWRGKG